MLCQIRLCQQTTLYNWQAIWNQLTEIGNNRCPKKISGSQHRAYAIRMLILCAGVTAGSLGVFLRFDCQALLHFCSYYVASTLWRVDVSPIMLQQTAEKKASFSTHKYRDLKPGAMNGSSACLLYWGILEDAQRDVYNISACPISSITPSYLLLVSKASSNSPTISIAFGVLYSFGTGVLTQ